MEGFFLTDAQIANLVKEPKHLGRSVDAILRGMKGKTGREGFLQNTVKFARTASKDKWLLYLRNSPGNPHGTDFSCGLGLIPAGRSDAFMIRRYNGNSHEHTNKIEKTPPFRDFHIHTATARYQKSSYDDDEFAERTDLFDDFHSAFQTLLTECNVIVPNRK